MSSELSFSFSTMRKFIQPKFTEDLQHSMALKLTVFQASNIGVNSSTAGANLHDDPRSGGTLIDHLDAKIIACLEREPFSSADSLIKALELSPAAVLSRLHNLLGMNIFISARSHTS
jgi:hypothetical protein